MKSGIGDGSFHKWKDFKVKKKKVTFDFSFNDEVSQEEWERSKAFNVTAGEEVDNLDCYGIGGLADGPSDNIVVTDSISKEKEQPVNSIIGLGDLLGLNLCHSSPFDEAIMGIKRNPLIKTRFG